MHSAGAHLPAGGNLSDFLSQIPLAICELDSSWRIVFSNEKTKRLLQNQNELDLRDALGNKFNFSSVAKKRGVSKGQIIVNTGSKFADHPGSQHQLVRDHFGVRRSFLDGRNKIA